MTTIDSKEAAELVAKIARDQVLEVMKTLVTVRVIDTDRTPDTAAITCSLQRAYDQLTVAFDLEVGRNR